MTNLVAIVTAYCACKACCGPLAPRPTASGRLPVPGLTVAAPRSIPFGTVVTIKTPTRTFHLRVDDRTARRYDGRWDIFMPSHQAALRFGRQEATVTIP